MALYALGDLHLSFQTDKSMDRFGAVWKDHEKKIEQNVCERVREEDTLVLTGDHSWGRRLSECEEDLAFIERLPGRKILLRGNHDMFWSVNKTAALNARYQGKLFFLQNNFAVYENYALVGTKGYTFEGPFYFNVHQEIIGWDQEKEKQAKKLIQREAHRLELSIQAAMQAGFHHFIMFLHYPPTSILEDRSLLTDIAEKYGVEQVIYSHCHGEARFHDSLLGEHRGIQYSLVSGDYLDFCPLKLL